MRDSNKQSSQTTSKRKKFAEESDESSDSEPSTRQPITQSTSQSASYVSRFLVMQSLAENSRCQRDSKHSRLQKRCPQTNKHLRFDFQYIHIAKENKSSIIISVNVEVYVPNPLRCYNCQFFGHHESRCTRKKVCANCGEVG